MSRSPNIVVIGSLNVDMIVKSDKFPEKGETILGQHFSTAMGGKGANQAVALARLGAEVSLIGAIGRDDFGKKAIANLKHEGINTSFITVIDNVETGVACVQLSANDNRITVIPGANFQLHPTHIDQAERILEKADAVLLQMEIPLETLTYAVKKVKKMGKIVILNPAPAVKLSKDILSHVDFLTPNETELQILADESIGNQGTHSNSAQQLLEMGVENIIVTLGAQGATYYTVNGVEKSFPAHFVNVVDTTGAGDAFNGGLTYALARGKTLDEAVTLAVKVGSLAVTKLGAQEGMPTSKELKSFLTK